MAFRTELHLKESKINIAYNDKLLLLGSCFSENIGHLLSRFKYSTVVNPLGIIYHPTPLHQSIIDAIDEKLLTPNDLNKNIDGQFTAWNIHSRLSSIDPKETLSKINESIALLRTSIQEADYLFLTYGTSYYYDHKEFGPVANCHKFPSIDFEKKLSPSNEIIDGFNKMLSTIKGINPNIQILLTVSPVRHIKDGIIENNRSKAQLITAVHSICELYPECHYLPSYELLIDDLRGYRFYADDMVHPSAKAIDYIWNKISDHILDKSESSLRSSIAKVVKAASHRPFNPNSLEHQKFLSTQKKTINNILDSYPFLDFNLEIKAFEN